MGIEYELKFRAEAHQLPAILAQYSGQMQEFQMETTYYDTPSGALSARHYTLRRRMENEESVCTLKTPAAGKGRQELELNCADIQQALPEFCKMGAPEDFAQVITEGILPVCGAKFHRTAITLESPDCCLELALDEGSLFGGGKSLPLCEVEVELKSGSRTHAAAYGSHIAKTYDLQPESRSKFRRALALARGEEDGV